VFIRKSKKKEEGKTWQKREKVENAQIGDFRDTTKDKKIEFRDVHRLWWFNDQNCCRLELIVNTSLCFQALVNLQSTLNNQQ
jgi:hypothetical protein